MMATAWNNGLYLESGGGYGVKLSRHDRDRHFHREWRAVTLELEGEPRPVTVNVDKPSFWGPTCRELISKDIGVWLRQQGVAPWPTGNPPKLELNSLGPARLGVRLAQSMPKQADPRPW